MWRHESRFTLLSGKMCAAALRILFACGALPACRQDMHDQPRYKPLASSRFFADGKSARELLPGTVPRGAAENDTPFYTGRRAGAAATPRPASPENTIPPPETPDKEQLAAWRAIRAAEAAGGASGREEALYIDELPLPLTGAVLARGRERFGIFCAVCHDLTGSGNGMVVRKGYSQPPSFHSERLRAAKLGHFFDVITNGFGAMPSYASQLSPADRWAVIAYVRALQLSQWADLDSVPSDERAILERSAKASEGGGHD